LAATGVPTGCPVSAAAEQFQPAADAEADMTDTLAAAAATTQSIVRTRNLLWDSEQQPPTTPRRESSGFPACPRH
jgi:hypothetical protein